MGLVALCTTCCIKSVEERNEFYMVLCTVNLKVNTMTRKDILKANGIDMEISKDRKNRLLKNETVAKQFPYHYNIKLDELENLFGEIEYYEYW